MVVFCSTNPQCQTLHPYLPPGEISHLYRHKINSIMPTHKEP